MVRTFGMWIVLAVAVFACNRSGGAAVQQTGMVERTLTIDPAFLEARVPVANRERIPTEARARTFFPEGMTFPTNRVVVGFASGAQNFAALRDLSDPWAEALSAGIVAVELPRHEDDHWDQYVYVSYLLSQLRAEGYLTADAKAVVVGFAEGGNIAMRVGVLGGSTEFDGVLAISIESDTATPTLRRGGAADANVLPIVVLNGTQDVVARYTDEIGRSLRDGGFQDVSIRRFDGGHTVPGPETLEAFEDLFD